MNGCMLMLVLYTFLTYFLLHVSVSEALFKINLSEDLASKLTPALSRDSTACNTPRCLKITKEILSMINISSNPCENPNLYFCGNWIKEFKLPREESFWIKSFSTINNDTREHLRELLQEKPCPKINKKVKPTWDDMLSCYYEACTNENHLNSMQAMPLINLFKREAPFLLQRVVDPNIIDNEQISVKQKPSILSKRLAVLKYHLNVDGFFKIDVRPSMLDKEGRYALYLSAAGLALRYQQYEENNIVRYYLDYITDLLTIFTTEVQNISVFDLDRLKPHLRTRALNVLKMELDIKNISLTPEEQRDPHLKANLKTREEIQSSLKSSLDFDFLYEPIISMMAQNVTKKYKSEFIVDSPSFLKNLSTLIASQWSWGTIHDYMVLRVLKRYATQLSTDYKRIVDTFASKISGSTPEPRWRKCLTNSKTSLGWVLSLRYLRSINTLHRRKKIVEELILTLKNALADVLKSTRWMDDKTKTLALRKLNIMTHKIAFPDWLLSNYDTYFSRYYGQPNVNVMRNLLTGSIHISREFLKFKIGQLGQPKDRTEWNIYPYTTNAFFNLLQNEVVVPLSLLQKPFLHVWSECTNQDEDCSIPVEVAFMKLLTYGGLGSIIGHELIHGFDHRGKKFGSTGQAAFKEKSGCIRDQYGNYSVQVYQQMDDHSNLWSLQKIPLSSQLNLGENIADNAGLKLAYSALKQLHPEYFKKGTVSPELNQIGFTPAILFTSSFAQVWCGVIRERYLTGYVLNDVHPPTGFRILGTLSNLQMFSDAWKCPLGSKMNPSHRGRNVKSTQPNDQSAIQLIVSLNDEIQTKVWDEEIGIIAPVMRSRCAVW